MHLLTLARGGSGQYFPPALLLILPGGSRARGAAATSVTSCALGQEREQGRLACTTSLHTVTAIRSSL